MGGLDAQLNLEFRDLGLAPDRAEVVEGGAAGEPYVRSVEHGLVGLALSGGGIRSATFSLGFLKGLADLDLLRLFHYLSTVSGGGYIGGWWSAYLTRAKHEGGSKDTPGADESRFPYPSRREPESHSVRHLREFSRFLAPRLGFFELETGELALAYLGVLVPSLALTASLICAGAWSFDLWRTQLQAGWVSAAYTSGLTTLAVLLLSEKRWRDRKKCDPDQCGGWIPVGLVSLFVSGLVGASAFLALASPTIRPRGSEFDFFPPLPWLLTTVGLLLVVRPLTSVWRRSASTTGNAIDLAVERTQIRVLCLLLLVLGAVLICWRGWHLQADALAWMAALAGVGNVSFALAIKWLADRAQAFRSAGKSLTGVPLLKRWFAEHGVRVLAIAVCLMLFVIGSSVVDRLGSILSLALVLALLLVGLLLMPTGGGGLHQFYASRLARAYLADSVGKANRQTQASPHDDLLMAEVKPQKGPVHLVCCAVNDLAGDPLTTLNRGARSAAYSRHGFAFGNAFAAWDPAHCPSLSSALGASGAALNSNMGSLSKALGPAVTFLACALNLRLGAWLARVGGPGKLGRWSASSSIAAVEAFCLEMFGLTQANDEAALVHVSDGGHFENLGLYELVRRHCRYIVVVDAGMDSEPGFEDLGNALRRIRQDFGVEVDLSLDALRRSNGVSRQHAVVGDLRYPNGHRGVLIYVKPTLIGDEPADVLHYRSAHAAFPHESTVDQFFDDEQWEAYRRLGEHIAHSVFDFVNQLDASPEERAPATIFTEARWRWYPASVDLRSTFLELTSGFDQAESLLWKSHDGLLVDVYPEAGALERHASGSGRNGGSPKTLEQPRLTLPVMIQVTQMMEDVWFATDLDRNGNHPMAQGWLNYFRRWASAPRYRAWWPLLSPCFSLGFRRFMELRFDLLPANKQPLDLRAAEPHEVKDALLIAQWQGGVSAQKEGAHTIVGKFSLPSGEAELSVAALRFKAVEQTAEWSSRDLVVLPSVRWAGFGSAFLRELLKSRPGPLEKMTTFRVAFPKLQSFSHYERQDQADRMQFYAAAGFEEAREAHDMVTLEWTNARPVPAPGPPPEEPGTPPGPWYVSLWPWSERVAPQK